jgi:Alpha/beta hydrolase family
MGKVISKDGTAIVFDKSGEGAAIILVSGAFTTRSQPTMVQLAALLAPHFSVFNYDRRGRGESGDTPPYAVEREVEDLAALINDSVGSPGRRGRVLHDQDGGDSCRNRCTDAQRAHVVGIGGSGAHAHLRHYHHGGQQRLADRARGIRHGTDARDRRRGESDMDAQRRAGGGTHPPPCAAPHSARSDPRRLRGGHRSCTGGVLHADHALRKIIKGES